MTVSGLERARRLAVDVPNGRVIFGHIPGCSGGTLLEHRLRDRLARDLRGHGAVTEATLPYGRADVLTRDLAIEVEPARAWRHAVRQALQYAAQTGCRPAVALFGAAGRDDVLRIYLRLRDSAPPVELWWFESCWERITSRACARARRAPVLPVS